MKGAMLVFFGGGLGATARYGVNLLAAAWFGAHFPSGTLIVNVVGGLVMGMMAGFLSHRGAFWWAGDLRLLIMTGILGGFTTFSAYSLDAVVLWERGEMTLAAGYVIASVVLSIAALTLGLHLTRAFA